MDGEGAVRFLVYWVVIIVGFIFVVLLLQSEKRIVSEGTRWIIMILVIIAIVYAFYSTIWG